MLRRLLPLAHQGLEAWGVPAEERDRLLGVIEERCLQGSNGAEWFVRRMAGRRGEDRRDAVRTTLLEYMEGMHANEPAHTWQ